MVVFFSGQLTIRDAELTAAIEERDNARRDLSETHLAKDEIVKKAWDLRDQAGKRSQRQFFSLSSVYCFIHQYIFFKISFGSLQLQGKIKQKLKSLEPELI